MPKIVGDATLRKSAAFQRKILRSRLVEYMMQRALALRLLQFSEQEMLRKMAPYKSNDSRLGFTSELSFNPIK